MFTVSRWPSNWNLRRLRKPSPTVALSWALLILIVFLVAYPLMFTIFDLVDKGIHSNRTLFGSGGIDSSIFPVFRDTVIVVVLATVIALFVGSLLAWLTERTDGGLKGGGDFLPLMPLMVPGIGAVIGWMILLDPRVGFINIIIRNSLELFGIHLEQGPFNIFSAEGLIGMTALTLVPFAFLVVSSSLRRYDPSLEEASRVSGGGPLRTFLQVTFPSISPALGAASLLCIITGIGLFSVPVVLGGGAGMELLSVRIFRYITLGYPARTDLAIILAGVMLATVQVLLYAQRRIISTGRHSTLGGRGVRSSRVELGPWRVVAQGMSIGYVLFTAVLPAMALIIVSLQHFWTPHIRWSDFTLANYDSVLFQDTRTIQGLKTSLTLGLLGATITMLCVGFLMIREHDKEGMKQSWIDAITTLPATIPHSVVGVSFLVAFGRPPWPLYGTIYILLIAYIMMQLPYAARTASVAASEIGKELSEASRVSGASERRTFQSVMLPLALPGLAAGWAIVFVHIIGELTASAMLSGTNNQVISRVLLDKWNEGSFPEVASIAIVISVVNSVFVMVALYLSRRSGYLIADRP